MTLAGRIARKALPKSSADRLASTVNRFKNYRKLRRELAALNKQAVACRSLDEKVDLIRRHEVFGAIQQRSEILNLLRMLQQNPPQSVCESALHLEGPYTCSARCARPMQS